MHDENYVLTINANYKSYDNFKKKLLTFLLEDVLKQSLTIFKRTISLLGCLLNSLTTYNNYYYYYYYYYYY
jgi:hypothetical protein